MLWENLRLTLRADFLAFSLVCIKAMEPIYLMSVSLAVLTTLKGLVVASRLAMILQSSLFFVRLACFGMAVNFSMSKSY